MDVGHLNLRLLHRSAIHEQMLEPIDSRISEIAKLPRPHMRHLVSIALALVA